MNSKQKNILIGGLLAIVLILGVAYAAFQSQLNITGTTSIDSKWDVRIISITPDKTATNSGTEASPNYTTAGDISHSITNNDLTANFAAGLVSPGDTVVYTIKVKNNGTLNAALNTLTKTPSTNPAITFEVSGIEQNDILNAGAEKEFTVTVAYANVESQPTSTTASFSLTLNFVQTNESSSDSGTGGGSSSNLNTVYAFHTDMRTIGTSTVTDGVQDYTELDSYKAGKTWFLKYDLDSDNVIQNAYACQKFTFIDDPVCVQGGKDADSNSYYGTSTTGNRGIIEGLASTFEANGGSCSADDDTSNCGVGVLNVNAYSSGFVTAGDSSTPVFCYVLNDGSSFC